MPDDDRTAKIISEATAVPKYKISQNDVEKLAARVFGASMDDFSRLAPEYGNAAIKTRYSCVLLEWYEKPCPFSERNRLCQKNAVNLLAEAGQKALAKANLSFDDIDGLVVVSSSGIATPSLDALLLAWRIRVENTALAGRQSEPDSLIMGRENRKLPLTQSLSNSG